MNEMRPDEGDLVVFCHRNEPVRLEHFRPHADWREKHRPNVSFWEYTRPGIEHASTNDSIRRVIAYVGID